MSLPEIPDVARRAMNAEYVLAIPENLIPDHHDPARMSVDGDACMHAGLDAAWPYLYAAALRHAADEMDAADESWAVRELRHMADEATP